MYTVVYPGWYVPGMYTVIYPGWYTAIVHPGRLPREVHIGYSTPREATQGGIPRYIHHPMYTLYTTRVYTPPVHPLGIPASYLYPGVPVPPYTGVMLPDDGALGSRRRFTLGEASIASQDPKSVRSW